MIVQNPVHLCMEMTFRTGEYREIIFFCSKQLPMKKKTTFFLSSSLVWLFIDDGIHMPII